jgi:hypothetical protein
MPIPANNDGKDLVRAKPAMPLQKIVPSVSFLGVRAVLLLFN